MIKKLLSIILAFVSLAMLTACDPDEILDQKGTFYYNLYTSSQNCNGSDFEAFDVLYDLNSDGDEVNWMFSLSGMTREEADAKALEMFADRLELIDDAAACSGLNGDDYLSAIMQRVEGHPHDLLGKRWTASGTTML
ncbi:MAG: hypothetical protein MJZ81_02940 [Bacteroidales bacterium]|nr:hypothetical protein [Bacteroidales bacterium]